MPISCQWCQPASFKLISIIRVSLNFATKPKSRKSLGMLLNVSVDSLFLSAEFCNSHHITYTQCRVILQMYAWSYMCTGVHTHTVPKDGVFSDFFAMRFYAPQTLRLRKRDTPSPFLTPHLDGISVSLSVPLAPSAFRHLFNSKKSIGFLTPVSQNKKVTGTIFHQNVVGCWYSFHKPWASGTVRELKCVMHAWPVRCQTYS